MQTLTGAYALTGADALATAKSYLELAISGKDPVASEQAAIASALALFAIAARMEEFIQTVEEETAEPPLTCGFCRNEIEPGTAWVWVDQGQVYCEGCGHRFSNEFATGPVPLCAPLRGYNCRHCSAIRSESA